jgi:CRP-like cAMP-binding protein
MLGQIVVDCLALLLRDLEANRSSRFALPNGCSIDRITMRRHVNDLQADNVTSTKLAVDRHVRQREREAHARVKEMSTEEVARRIAHAVLRLVEQSGRQIDDGVLVDFPITHQDIAQVSGTTLHSVSRVLSAWEDAGLVSIGRRKIVVRDLKGLARVAEPTDCGHGTHSRGD